MGAARKGLAPCSLRQQAVGAPGASPDTAPLPGCCLCRQPTAAAAAHPPSAPFPQIVPASSLRTSGLLLSTDFRDAAVPETGKYILQV